MRKLILTLIKENAPTLIATVIVMLISFSSADAAPRCAEDWTPFTCAVWQLGLDEYDSYRAGKMSYEQFVTLTDVHEDIFWTAKGQEQNEHSHDMQVLGPKLKDYSIAVGRLAVLRVITPYWAHKLVDDLVAVEKALTGPGMWFGDPKAPGPESEEK